MPNFFQDNDDLLYYVERGIDWEPLVEAVERGFRLRDGFRNAADAVATYRDIVDMVGTFAAEEVAPHAAELERQGVRLEAGEVVLPPRLETIGRQMQELSLHGMTMPRELGGMGCPSLLYYLASELIARADVSVLTHFSFYTAIAEALLLYSIAEGSTSFDAASGALEKTRFAREIREIARGEAHGSMDITEAGAGSDMAAIRARAEQGADGRWYVSGEKIFITAGQGKHHLVVARTEDEASAPGLKGLSLFLVPAYETDAGGTRRRFAQIERLEDKLGHHASPTCVMTFDRSPAELVGRRGEGFRLMLHLMNGARIGVGFEALGLCESAYRLARSYAAERVSMGKALDRHEIIADYLDEARTDIQVIRALAVHAAYHEEMALRLTTRLDHFAPESPGEVDELRRRVRRHRRTSRRMTPLVKYLAAEKAVEIARRSLQIHGGIGYTTELGAERLVRDSLAMPIYEGTSQMQALMAMKDTLGAILRNPRAFVARVARVRWRALSARDPLARRVARLVAHGLRAQQHLLSRTAADKLKALTHEPISTWPRALRREWDPKRDFAHALLHAERLTRLLADAAGAEILLAQAQKHPERRELLERHLERAEPRARHLAHEIRTTGGRLLARLGGDDKAAGKPA